MLTGHLEATYGLVEWQSGSDKVIARLPTRLHLSQSQKQR